MWFFWGYIQHHSTELSQHQHLWMWIMPHLTWHPPVLLGTAVRLWSPLYYGSRQESVQRARSTTHSRPERDGGPCRDAPVGMVEAVPGGGGPDQRQWFGDLENPTTKLHTALSQLCRQWILVVRWSCKGMLRHESKQASAFWTWRHGAWMLEQGNGARRTGDGSKANFMSSTTGLGADVITKKNKMV